MENVIVMASTSARLYSEGGSESKWKRRRFREPGSLCPSRSRCALAVALLCIGNFRNVKQTKGTTDVKTRFDLQNFDSSEIFCNYNVICRYKYYL